MLEEMHDPVLSQPIFVKAMSSQVRALKNICVCSDVCGHFCYWYNVAQYYLSHLGDAAHYLRRKTYLGVHVFKTVQCLKAILWQE